MLAMVRDKAMGSRARAKTAGDQLAVQSMDQQHLVGVMVRHSTFITPLTKDKLWCQNRCAIIERKSTWKLSGVCS